MQTKPSSGKLAADRSSAPDSGIGGPGWLMVGRRRSGDPCVCCLSHSKAKLHLHDRMHATAIVVPVPGTSAEARTGAALRPQHKRAGKPCCIALDVGEHEVVK